LELFSLTFAFRRDDATRYRDAKHTGLQAGEPVNSLAMLRYPALWLCAAFLLVYVGTEAAISGWVVVFMTRARHASTLVASACSSAFWAGMAAGRLSLGAATDRIGVARAVVAYLLGAALASVLFAVVEHGVADVLLLSAVGFFAGPLFPSGIVRLTSLLPPALHVAGVSFVSSMGQVGAALLPFALGMVVDAVGIRAFQGVILAQFGAALLVWLAFARLRVRGYGGGED
jgi:fucose permease